MRRKIFFTVSIIEHWKQRGRGVCILGNIQNLTGQHPRQSSLVNPALNRDIGLDSLQKALPAGEVTALNS